MAAAVVWFLMVWAVAALMTAGYLSAKGWDPVVALALCLPFWWIFLIAALSGDIDA